MKMYVSCVSVFFVFVSVAEGFVRGEGKGGRGGMESWRGRGHTKRRGEETTNVS